MQWWPENGTPSSPVSHTHPVPHYRGGVHGAYLFSCGGPPLSLIQRRPLFLFRGRCKLRVRSCNFEVSARDQIFQDSLPGPKGLSVAVGFPGVCTAGHCQTLTLSLSNNHKKPPGAYSENNTKRRGGGQPSVFWQFIGTLPTQQRTVLF